MFSNARSWISESVQGRSKILHVSVDLEMMCAREPGNRVPDQPHSGHDVSPLPQLKPHLIKNTKAPHQLRVFLKGDVSCCPIDILGEAFSSTSLVEVEDATSWRVQLPCVSTCITSPLDESTP